MFPDTPWTLIAEATLHGDEGGRKAMEGLCSRYYQPVRSFIVWQGRSSDEADDLTQSFFLYVCDKGIMQRADRLRGKFRTFIIAVLKHFLSHEHRAAGAQRRGGGAEMELEEADAALEDEGQNDARFDTEWALALMDAALARVAEEITQARGVEALETLGLFLSMQQTAPSYETAADMMGVTVPAVKMDVMRWRKRLSELVRSEIGRTVSAPHEVDDELAYLRRLLTA
jgi:DNA-directed RNA polymerase specialized sigma24 family protein